MPTRNPGDGTMSGVRRKRQPMIRVLAYGPEPTDIAEAVVDNLQLAAQFQHVWPVTWISVNGLEDKKLVRYLGELFGIHPLGIEDVIQRQRRSKVEQYGDHLFILAQIAKRERYLMLSQLGIFVGNRFVLTFQEEHDLLFEPIRDRIRAGHPALRRSGADYLMYSIVDTLVNSYFPILEYYSEELDVLEDEAFTSQDNTSVARLHALKHELFAVRRAVWPMRELGQIMARLESNIVADDTKVYLRDSMDRALQVTELVDTYRDLASGLVDVYLSTGSNRLNEVMKVLTMISTIFIPLSFVSGLYGMNFNSEKSPWNMPELNYYWGYPISLGIMALIVIVEIVYFRHKGWIGGARKQTHTDYWRDLDRR